MKKYCEECRKEVNTQITIKREVYNVCGESIEVDAQILSCVECGEEFFCEELDSKTLENAYNKYRERHKLLHPKEIKKIREQYGLSQRSFAKLLNWGDKTIQRYENGSIQDKAHNSLLLFLRETENMRTYLLENEVVLDEKKKSRVLDHIEELEHNSARKYGKKFEQTIFATSPSIDNGFKSLDFEKLCAMVIFFAQKAKGLLKVKLLKLLNYSDMIYYKENGISMSGAQYVHLPYGPVLQNYDILFGIMEAEKMMHIEVEFDNGYEKHQVIPDCNLEDGALTESEMAVLKRVFNKFASFGSVEISNYSHREKGYCETKNGEVISYAYAKDIQL